VRTARGGTLRVAEGRSMKAKSFVPIAAALMCVVSAGERLSPVAMTLERLRKQKTAEGNQP